MQFVKYGTMQIRRLAVYAQWPAINNLTWPFSIRLHFWVSWVHLGVQCDYTVEFTYALEMHYQNLISFECVFYWVFAKQMFKRDAFQR